MQRKYKTIIAFGLMAVITYTVGFQLGQKKELLTGYAKAHTSPRIDRKIAVERHNPDQVAAILLMPRSYLPLLESFKQRKIARSIKILPADISWKDGQMRFQPKVPIGIEKGNAMHQKGRVGGMGQGLEPKMAAGENPNLRGPMALFFLRSIAAGNRSNLGLQSSVPQEAL